MTTGIIYWVKNKLNGHRYIGQTSKTLEKRMIQHKWESANPKRRRTVFHKALAKYGVENFEAEVIEDGFESQDELDAAEILWIMGFGYYNTAVGGLWGGLRGKSHTEEAKRKMRLRRAQQGPGGSMSGKKHSEEARRKMSERRKGRTVTEETKRKLRGRRHTPETVEKIRNANLGRTHTPETIEKLRNRRTPQETRKKLSESRKRMPRPGKGYRYKKSVGRWEAYTSENRKFKYLGMYATETEAKEASDRAKADFLARVFKDDCQEAK